MNLHHARRRIAVAGAAVALLIAGAACGNNNFRDVKGVASHDADSYTLWNNVDRNPNIVRVCTDGIAWATTTRSYGDAIQRVPEWDAFCKTQVRK